MKLTKSQDTALVAINNWIKQPWSESNWLFTLAGYAGTGKTTLLSQLINNLRTKPVCCAPTGKAASVLRSKLKEVDVRTVHQILYVPCDRKMNALDSLIAARIAAISDGESVKVIKALDTEIAKEKDRLANERISFSIKADSKIKGKLVIVDEASMVSEKMMLDFSRTGAKVLFVGDSFQLPPVNATPWFLTRDHNVTLTEVLRQALDSPIIRLSVQIRDRYIEQSEFKKGDCVLCEKKALTYDDWIACDQVLTGSNASRQRINRFFRKQLAINHSNLPLSGDKMICLKNDHYKMPAWINGVQFKATADAEVMPEGHLGLFAEYEGVHLNGIEFYQYNCLANYDHNAEQLDREMRGGMFECDYAYAITVHKSQGSEWPFVIVADDKMKNEDKAFRQKWLYTAVTRAKEKLIVVQ